MEQHISSPTHNKRLYLSFTQSRHVLPRITVLQNVLLKSRQEYVKKKKKKKKKNPAVKI